jgi:hypothetical protein
MHLPYGSLGFGHSLLRLLTSALPRAARRRPDARSTSSVPSKRYLRMPSFHYLFLVVVNSVANLGVWLHRVLMETSRRRRRYLHGQKVVVSALGHPRLLATEHGVVPIMFRSTN